MTVSYENALNSIVSIYKRLAFTVNFLEMMIGNCLGQPVLMVDRNRDF
jgi:hypothetical protein